MILEKIIINGVKYYNWTYSEKRYPFRKTYGDLFSKWSDIPMEKIKFKEQLKIK